MIWILTGFLFYLCIVIVSNIWLMHVFLPFDYKNEGTQKICWILSRSEYLHWLLLLLSFYKLNMVGANGWCDSYQDKFCWQTDSYRIRSFQRNHLHTLSFWWYLPKDLPEMFFSVHTFLCVPGQNDVIHKNLDPFHNTLMCSSLSGFKFHMASKIKMWWR